MIIHTNGRLIPVLPTGEVIPCIARDSIKYSQDDEDWRNAGLVRVSLDLIVHQKDIEGGFPVEAKGKPLYAKYTTTFTLWYYIVRLCLVLKLRSAAVHLVKNKKLYILKQIK